LQSQSGHQLYMNVIFYIFKYNQSAYMYFLPTQEVQEHLCTLWCKNVVQLGFLQCWSLTLLQTHFPIISSCNVTTKYLYGSQAIDKICIIQGRFFLYIIKFLWIISLDSNITDQQMTRYSAFMRHQIVRSNMGKYDSNS
jgi:hypothetical protein